jgi:hypothetical protein
MQIEVKRLPNEPIIIVTYTGAFEAEVLKSAFRQSVGLLDEIGEKAYRISDVRNLDEDKQGINEMFKVIVDLRKDPSGSSADPRIHAVLVGGHQLARLYAEFMRQDQFGKTQLPFFNTLDEALEYIHFKIKEDQNLS